MIKFNYSYILLIIIILTGKSFTQNDNQINSVIYSSAKDSLIFSVTQKKYILYGNSKITYENSSLNSNSITVDFNNNLLSTNYSNDTSNIPTLIDDGEKYTGKSIIFNFKNKQGIISYASNKSQSGYYQGNVVNKVSDNIFLAKNAKFTTCEHTDDPDYNFSASQMKIVSKDKIIAKWIYLEFEGVPLPLPFPFAIIPFKSGRRSGILIPSIGERQNAGTYISGLGFYWATNDYMDLTFKSDYYTRGGYNFQNNFRYYKKYSFDGNIDLAYSKLILGSKSDPDYNITKDYKINIIHNQTFTPSAKLNINLSYLSGSYLRNNSFSYQDVLNKNIYSSLVFNKFYDNGNSFVVSYSRNQDLQTNNVYEILPSISFSMPSSYIFRTKNSKVYDLKWYEQVSFNYNINIQNNKNKINSSVTNNYGIYHKPSISYTPKIGYFNVSPYINYDEKWYFKYTEINNYIKNGKDSIIEKEKNGFNAVRTFSLGLSTSTTLYGILNINNFGIQAFRHVFKPSISYSYMPDFSDEKWGYYEKYQLANGKSIKYDKFSKQIFGGAPSGEKQNISLNLSNIYEIKLNTKDTTKTTDKIQLLNWNSSLSYNLAADSLKLSDLYLSYRTQINNFNVSASNTFTFYDQIGYTKINKFLLDSKNKIARMTSFNLNLSYKLMKSGNSSDTNKYKNTNVLPHSNVYNTDIEYLNSNWELNLNYSFSQSNPTKDITYKNSTLGLALNLNLTKNWRASFLGNYDIQAKKITAPQITLYRDLHCWEMFFYWLPNGVYSNYRLEIRVKASELQDLKITRSRGFYSGR